MGGEIKVLNNIKEIFENGNVLDADKLLDVYSGEKNILYWQLKGAVYQKMQKWGDAINSFQKVIDLEPDNKEASVQLEIIKNILNFWNPEMFNA